MSEVTHESGTDDSPERDDEATEPAPTASTGRPDKTEPAAPDVDPTEREDDDTGPLEAVREALHTDDGPLGDKPYPKGRYGDRQDDGEDAPPPGREDG